MAFEIYIFDKGMFAENTYVLKNNDECIVIDPGYWGNDVKKCIGNACLKYILITHSHQDHIGAIKHYMTNYPNAKIVSVGYKQDIAVNDELILDFNGIKINFITTPGHSTDGMCALIEDKLFSGDTLFYMSVGATHFPGGNADELFESITNKLFILDDEIIVYPGHGKSTTIGFEKRHNPFV